MRYHTSRIVILVTAAVGVIAPASSANGAEPHTVLLWPAGAPDAKGDTEDDRPMLTVHLPDPEKATGVGVIICPGGGYHGLAMEYEGHDVAAWLNSIGAAGFVLKYRHRGTGYGHPTPWHDGQRAVRFVRARAKAWGIDPERIGILGFSAGGHLASTVGTHFDAGKPDSEDPIERQSARPDFMILIYPVISFVEPYTHQGSKRNLLGPKPNPKTAEFLSSERQVTRQTPPAFIVHGTDDGGVPVKNSIDFYTALLKAKVPAEMHLYRHGPHGFGLGSLRGASAGSWPALCADWMGALDAPHPREPDRKNSDKRSNTPASRDRATPDESAK